MTESMPGGSFSISVEPGFREASIEAKGVIGGREGHRASLAQRRIQNMAVKCRAHVLRRSGDPVRDEKVFPSLSGASAPRQGIARV